MAEKPASDDLAVATQEDRDAGSGGVSGDESVHRQGESLLLPYLQQLKATLKIDATPSRDFSAIAKENRLTAAEGFETDPGEESRLLAGLRDSIRQHEVKQDGETDVGGLLTEIQNNLKTLQSTLNSRMALGKVLDPDTKNGLLELIVRLQNSLTVTESGHETKQASKNRFFNKRHARQNRHTVGVTKEELADARRLFEVNRHSIDVPDSETLNCNVDNVEESENNFADSNESAFPSYALLKQNSVGGLSNKPMYKPFKSVKFNPGKAVAGPVAANHTAKPNEIFAVDEVVPGVQLTQSESAIENVNQSQTNGRSIRTNSLPIIGNYFESHKTPPKNDIFLPKSFQTHLNAVAACCADGGDGSGMAEPKRTASREETVKEPSANYFGKCLYNSDKSLVSTDDEGLNDSFGESDSESLTIKRSSMDSKLAQPNSETYPPIVANGYLAGNYERMCQTASSAFVKPVPENKMKRINTVERRIQEIQNENRHQSRRGGKTIEELQKAYKERKERETEKRKMKFQNQNEGGRVGHQNWENQSAHEHVSYNNHDGSRVPGKSEDDWNLGQRPKPRHMDADYHGGGDFIDGSRTESEMSISSTTSTESGISHAQKLLMMATNDHGQPRHSDRNYLKKSTEQTQPVVSNAIWRKDRQHPFGTQDTSSAGADQWENRFSRIKIAFENPRTGGEVKSGSGPNHNSTKDFGSFGKSAGDSGAVDKSNRSASYANGPRSTLEGGKFSKKQFDVNKGQENFAKVPRASPSGTETPGFHPTASQRFNESYVQVPKPSTKFNQFRHAPMSAFKPVQKKSSLAEGNKARAEPEFVGIPQENKNPILPWIKDQGAGAGVGDKSVNTTLAKFETLSSPKQNSNANYNTCSNAAGSFSLQKSPSQPVLGPGKSDFHAFLPNATCNYNNAYRGPPTEPIPCDAPSVKKKIQNFQNILAPKPVEIRCQKTEQVKRDKFKPVTTYSVDIASTSTVYDDSSTDDNCFMPSGRDPSSTENLEQHVAVSRIMGSANQQQAVTVRANNKWRDELELGSTAVKNQVNGFQVYSNPTNVSPKMAFPVKSSGANLMPSRSPQLPPKLPTGKTSPYLLSGHASPVDDTNKQQVQSATRRIPSAELLVSSPRPEESKGSCDPIMASRLQIPFKVPYGSSVASSPNDDLSLGERRSTSPDQSLVVRRSESWHQLAGHAKPRRPQSLYVPSDPPNLPVSPPRRSPNSLVKTRSSHALGFGGSQFEASFVNRASVEIKQKTVEEFLSQQKSPNPKKRHATPTTKSSVVELNDNLSNVDEAFDALFTSTIASEQQELERSRRQLSKSMSAASINSKRNDK